MNHQKFVNDLGLAALHQLSNSNPNAFLAADPDALIEAMEKQEDSSDLWGGQLDLKEDISILNEVDAGGPSSDSRYARIVRDAVGHLPPSEGLNEHRWATTNCFVLPRYVQKRWSHVQPSSPERLPNFVRRHWLDGRLTEARQDNAIARLWWLCEFSSRAAEHSDIYNADELLEAMANNVELYHQLLFRPNLIARSKLVASYLRGFLRI